MDIAAWLASLGLEAYAPAFAENRIGADVLPDLSDQDLRELGVAALGDRKRLLAAIAGLGALETDQPTTQAATAADAGERRQVTVLFADIAAFTKISERLGAEAMHQVLNRFFESADRIVEDFGGTIDKHIGDNVMAVFGAPIAHHNDAERAVRAALAIHEAARAIRLPAGDGLRLHIGIASGLVVAGGTGSDSHREYTVIGDSVNLAARLQGLAGPGETLISEALYREVSGRFRAVALGPQALKGIDRPVAIWRVEGSLDASGQAIGEGRGTPFVGRRAELGQCRAILAEVAAGGEGQTILLRGPAGIGKTRLAEEVGLAARQLGFTLHRCLVLDFGSRKGQGAIPALLCSLLGLPSSSDREARERAADAALAQGAYGEEERVFLNDLLDLPQPLVLSRLYEAMDEAARRAGQRRLLTALVAWAGREAPQLILVEDLHWADSTTLQCLAAVMAAAAENPVALMATTRPEGDPLEDAWRSASLDQAVSIINLGPLRASEAREMAVGFARAGEPGLAECLQRAAGNPLFLEQLLQNAVESASASTLGHVPGSIQSLVLARMDRLDALDKRALQAASVLGQHFSLGALRHLIELPDYDCDALLRHQLIRPEGEDYLFAHALIRDGVYESILTPARRQFHGKAAAFFQDGDLVLHAEHLERAGDPAAACAYLQAANLEMASYRAHRAAELLARGKDLAEDPADRVALDLALGEAYQESGAPEAARVAFEEALALAGEDRARCQARLGLAGAKRITDDLPGALEDLAVAEAIAARDGLVAEAARAHFLRGNLLFPQGDIEGCLREHGQALELARQAGLAELEAAALGGLADAEYLHGHYHSAHGRFTECVAVAREHGFGRIEVANLPMVAITAHSCGPVRAALALALESIEAARRVGHSRAEMIGHHAAYICYKPMGDLEQAYRHAGKAAELAETLGARRFVVEAECFMAEIEYLQGGRGTELDRVRNAMAITREIGTAYMGPSILGMLVLVTDDPAERQAAMAEAESMLAEGSISHNHIFFRCNAIDACLREGDYDQAAHHAAALRDYCPEPEMVTPLFIAERGLALARVGRGERGPALAAEIERLLAQGKRLQQEAALPDLQRALSAMEG